MERKEFVHRVGEARIELVKEIGEEGELLMKGVTNGVDGTNAWQGR